MVFLLFSSYDIRPLSRESKSCCFWMILTFIEKRFYQKLVFASIFLIFWLDFDFINSYDFRYECLSLRDSEVYKNTKRKYDELERSCKEICMQPCYSTSYKIQYSLASLRSSFESVPDFLELVPNVSTVTLNLFFNKFEITEMREVETLTLSSVIANVGGALGVFLGASAITLIELFMFICPYLCCILSEMFSSSVFGFLKSKRSVTVSSIASIKTTW